MNKQGFTLIELLIVVLIIGILASMALPGYSRAIEKSRSAEAMNMVKNINDAVYAFAAERSECPQNFSKILIDVAGTPNADNTEITGKDFIYKLNAATSAPIPGTSCGGVVAERTDESYRIWNPYQVINTESKKRTLACTSSTDKGINLCKSLGIYTELSPF